ncbi:MAG: nucleoside triphosphate pyrophosphohydrolase [Eubacteriales bacterium]|nr:nucleoside triphosphate pyrophosphohydrolase [Eubacteriales bacterium]
MELKDRYTFADLVEIMQFLRSDSGCPWDRVQTHESLRANLLEEAYETVEALEEGDPENLCEELGDLLLQVVFHAQIAADKGSFTLDEIITKLCQKLISRHTHLFGEDRAETAEASLETWEKNKRKEKKINSIAENFATVPKSFPALKRSQKLQKRAADWNFDWSEPAPVFAKVDEELAEFKAAYVAGDQKNLEEEAGDVLMIFANLLRHLGIDAELALNLANQKFLRRVSKMEELMSQDAIPKGPFPKDLTERYYKKVRALEAKENQDKE